MMNCALMTFLRPLACCLDPSHGPIRDDCNCASGAHSEHTLSSHHNFRPQDPIPAQPSSVSLLGLGEVVCTGPTLPYSSHGFGPLGIPSMAGITSCKSSSVTHEIHD
jgi:hypothetical protein